MVKEDKRTHNELQNIKRKRQIEQLKPEWMQVLRKGVQFPPTIP
jgi:hypothetical protein